MIDYAASGHSQWSEPTRIVRYADTDTGIEAIVDNVGRAGTPYRVIFRDTDAGQTIGISFHTDADRASSYALDLVVGRIEGRVSCALPAGFVPNK